MSSSNWRQPTVDEDWDSCPSETTNNSTTPPPKYSSLNVADNIGAGSNSTFRQEYLQDQRNMDLETGHIQPANTPLGWYTQVCNRIPVRKFFNNIPIKQICSYMTLENIFRFVGLIILCLFGLTAIVVGAVLAWDLVIYVVVNRTRVCNKSA